jgi:site-specific recombinase XerD
LEQLNAPLILDFLQYLQAERRCSPATRNARLAAIKSFMRFVQYRVPAVLDQIRAILAIPIQRADHKVVRSLSAEEWPELLDAPSRMTRLGIRDRAMIHVALTGGLRVSELVGLRMDAVRFEGRYLHLHVHGKGRKERVLLLWKVVADSLRGWLAMRGEAKTPEVFLNARGQAMTRSGFERVLRRHVAVAAARCSSLQRKRVSPHVLRHTCALNVLRATGDIRKVALWLGHEHTQTTDVYLQADPTLKLETLAGMTPPRLQPGKFRKPDRLMAALQAARIMRRPPSADR